MPEFARLSQNVTGSQNIGETDAMAVIMMEVTVTLTQGSVSHVGQVLLTLSHPRNYLSKLTNALERKQCLSAATAHSLFQMGSSLSFSSFHFRFFVGRDGHQGKLFSIRCFTHVVKLNVVRLLYPISG